MYIVWKLIYSFLFVLFTYNSYAIVSDNSKRENEGFQGTLLVVDEVWYNKCKKCNLIETHEEKVLNFSSVLNRDFSDKLKLQGGQRRVFCTVFQSSSGQSFPQFSSVKVVDRSILPHACASLDMEFSVKISPDNKIACRDKVFLCPMKKIREVDKVIDIPLIFSYEIVKKACVEEGAFDKYFTTTWRKGLYCGGVGIVLAVVAAVGGYLFYRHKKSRPSAVSKNGKSRNKKEIPIEKRCHKVA